MTQQEFEQKILEACNLLEQEVTFLQVTIANDKLPTIVATLEAPIVKDTVQ